MRIFVVLSIFALVSAGTNAQLAVQAKNISEATFFETYKTIDSVDGILYTLRKNQESVYREISEIVQNIESAFKELEENDPKAAESLQGDIEKLSDLRSFGSTGTLRELEASAKRFTGTIGTSKYCAWLKQQLAAVNAATKYISNLINRIIALIQYYTKLRDYYTYLANHSHGFLRFLYKLIAAYYNNIINSLIKWFYFLYYYLIQLYIRQAELLSLIAIYCK